MCPVSYGAVHVELEPYNSVDVQVKKRTPSQAEALKNAGIANPYSNLFLQNSKGLAPNEEAVITLKKIESKPHEENLDQFIIIDNSTNISSIDLLPGKYLVDGQLMLHKNHTLQPDERTYCIGLSGGDPKMIESKVKSMATGAAISALGSYAGLWAFGPAGLYMSAALAVAQLVFDCVGKEKDYTVPEEPLSMNPVPVGGVYGNVTITEEFLEKNGTATFYVYYFPPPTVIEELSVSSNYKEISKQYPAQIQPVRGIE